MTLLEQLQQLAPLAAAATAGPWGIGRWRQGFDPWAPLISPSIGAPICRMDRHGVPQKDAADAAFIAAARNLLTPENLTLLVAALAPDAPLLGCELQEYQIQCRKFGTAEWLDVALAYDEPEALALLAQVAKSWVRHEHRLVSLVLHTRLHPLTTY